MHTGNIIVSCFFSQYSAVYPCAYREHCYWSSKTNRTSGLSLCIQGTFYSSSFQQQKPRFIPVHTGNMQYSATCFSLPSVYPCVYREHLPILIMQLCQFGLSLCIQGTCGLRIIADNIGRFIPVYTGNIYPTDTVLILFTVYPCVYREHLIC